jgi:hypothetical protein
VSIRKKKKSLECLCFGFLIFNANKHSPQSIFKLSHRFVTQAHQKLRHHLVERSFPRNFRLHKLIFGPILQDTSYGLSRLSSNSLTREVFTVMHIHFVISRVVWVVTDVSKEPTAYFFNLRLKTARLSATLALACHRLLYQNIYKKYNFYDQFRF